MTIENSPTYIFNTHDEAEDAIRALSRSGIDMKKLSLIGKGYHSEEYPVGFYTVGDKIKTWGKTGAFWGAIWGLLISPAVFLIPGVGLLAMAGPIVATLIGGIEGAVLVGGVSALGAAMSQFGIHKSDIIKYESALKVDKYVLLVHGDAADLAKVGSVLSTVTTIACA